MGLQENLADLNCDYNPNDVVSIPKEEVKHVDNWALVYSPFYSPGTRLIWWSDGTRSYENQKKVSYK